MHLYERVFIHLVNVSERLLNCNLYIMIKLIKKNKHTNCRFNTYIYNIYIYIYICICIYIYIYIYIYMYIYMYIMFIT